MSYHSPINSSRQSQKQSNKKSANKQTPTKNNQLQQLILANQNFSEQYKGYYTIQQWRKLNQLLFNPNQYQQKTTVTNCWRLMKLINFGDDIIPTGLIFDCIMTLMNVDQTVQQTQVLLKAIFFKFIQLNGKYLTQKQREELAFFKVVRNVVEGYRKIIADKLDIDSSDEHQNSGKPHDRNQQLYLLHGVINYKKDLGKLKKIQTEFKQCTFQPKINQKSATIGQSRYMLSGLKKDPLLSEQSRQKKFGIIDQTQQFQGYQQKFRARPAPSFPQYDPPRQYFDHIQRIKKSRQIKNINSLSRKAPIPQTVKQFSIQKRNQQRIQNRLQNVRILFMIKVEVGKRIYRVKVRQNMGVNQTVNAIEKMVGFKNDQIVDVVKGYFLNWQRRQKIKNQQNSQEEMSQDGF